MSDEPHTNAVEEKGRYRVLRAEQSSCPDCGRLVHLLTTYDCAPAFYLCFGCRFVGQVGVGRIAVPEAPRELPGRQPEHWDFDDAVAYLEHMKHLDGLTHHQIKTGAGGDWRQARGWFERLVREYRHKVEVAQSWFEKHHRVQLALRRIQLHVQTCSDDVMQRDSLLEKITSEVDDVR